jgi:hypothetical protein
MFKKSFIFISCFLTLVSVVVPTFSYGSTNDSTSDYQFLAPLTDPQGQNVTATNFPEYLQGMYRLFIGLAGILAVLVIMYGGIVYMSSTDAAEGKRQGKEIITRALIGLVLVIGSAALLAAVNPRILSLKRTTVAPTQTPSNNNWCTLVTAGEGGTAVTKSTDCFPDQVSCQAQVASYQGKTEPYGIGTANSCYIGPREETNLANKQYCIDVTILGKPYTTDCSTGAAFTENPAARAECNGKIDYYQRNYTDFDLKSPTCIVYNNKLCVEKRDKSTETTFSLDCTEQLAFTESTTQLNICRNKVNYWTFEAKAPLHASPCFNKNNESALGGGDFGSDQNSGSELGGGEF